MKTFFLVLARDEEYVDEKIRELRSLGFPYIIICGKKLNIPEVVYREPKGKYDAINFGYKFVPKDVDIVALNDVDTKVHNVENALRLLNTGPAALVFARVSVKTGPQKLFYRLLDPIRRMLPINASGELMFVRREALEKVLPLRPCKSEDSYILFKVMEYKYPVAFCEECHVVTERTKTAAKEEAYKRRVVCGLYQALSCTRPSSMISLFYFLLPFASPLLLVTGKKGYFWMKGILLGLADFLRGDRSGVWRIDYMK